ncbi:extracellular solute-binding protein [Paenibacillus sp. GCM10027626]|uniref:extracellular solute-binding protein n=1 Tax=Paenibacillus sp. GCM10027626 TaxID=3273411 RepID=UPI0036320316
MKIQMRAISIMLVCVLAGLSIQGCSKSEEGGGQVTDGGAGQKKEPVKEAEEDVYPENGLPKNEKVTLKFGFFDAGMGREWFDYAVDTFKQKFPNVDFAITYSPTIDQIIQTKIAAGDDEDMFDMFNSTIPGGTKAMAPLVKANKLEPTEDLWDSKVYDANGKTVRELSADGIEKSAPRILGKTYDFPIAGTGAGLFFDKTLFEQNGWNQNPKTWNEFVQLLEDIKTKGLIPITYPGVYPNYLENAFGPWKLFELAENNGNLQQFEDNYRNFKLPEYMSPEMQELWKRIYELGQKGYFPEGVAALDHTQSQMQVLQHQAAMVSTGSWVENEMKDSTPEGFKWGFMAVPMGDTAGSTIWTRSSSRSGSYIWAAKPELNKKWAKQFSLWMWNMDIQQLIAEKGGQLPLRKDFADDPVRAEKLQDVSKAMLEYMKNNKVMGESSFRNVTLTDPAYSNAVDIYYNMITEVTSGKLDPIPKLQEAEELMKKAVAAQGGQ